MGVVFSHTHASLKAGDERRTGDHHTAPFLGQIGVKRTCLSQSRASTVQYRTCGLHNTKQRTGRLNCTVCRCRFPVRLCVCVCVLSTSSACCTLSTPRARVCLPGWWCVHTERGYVVWLACFCASVPSMCGSMRSTYIKFTLCHAVRIA